MLSMESGREEINTVVFYRHIPALKRGQFQEREVICGFRFEVG
jgi:hypothetical protein